MKNTIASTLKLNTDQLYRRCNISDFTFDSTDELEPLEYSLIGQDRAHISAEFGIKMERDGYNMYALGPEETDKRNLLENLIKKEAANRSAPSDLCYVCNFQDENKPIALELYPGQSVKLRNMMNSFCEDLPNILHSAFESDEYQNRRQTIEEQLKSEEDEAFKKMQENAREKGLTILTTPLGYTFVPIKEGRVMNKEEINKLSDDERKRLEKEIQNFQKELQKILRQIPERQRKFRLMRNELNKEFAEFSVKGLLEEIEQEFSEQPKVLTYLKQVREDIIERVEEIINPAGSSFLQPLGITPDKTINPSDHPVLWRYTVNILVNNENTKGAPIIYEDNPTYHNLIGHVEHVSEMGTLTTDFTYIKPGALHKANGGYLLLDAMHVLMQPFAWEGLKRVLQSNKLKIESPGDIYGLYKTITLDPEPIDSNIKVVLIGSRLLYYLLCAYDIDFKNLFKVDVDFEDEIKWDAHNQELYARLVSGIAKKYSLNPLDKNAVGRIIEHAARMVDDNEKITTHIRDIIDLMREADFWAKQEHLQITNRKSVQKAIDQQIYRSARLKDRYQEEILRNTIFIDTTGRKVGQVNGLSVVTLGKSTFGHPTRITARVQVGKGEVINIEREVEMSGPIHSKGVLILTAFLGAHYAIEKPFSLSASLVFEQSYGGVEGDSASSTELYALLSAIGQIPLNQSVAVTGSVNQHGYIQPIGGVNEKIEGFFDICKHRGLTGDQGVLIPQANIKNLMLKQEVLDAVSEGQFSIYAIETIDEGMTLLSDKPMGTRDQNGQFPEGTVNYIVEQKLDHFASIRRDFAASLKPNGQNTE